MTPRYIERALILASTPSFPTSRSSHPSRSDLLSPACRTSSSRTPRPRKTFSLNYPGRICDTDAAPLHNQLRPTGRIPALFDSLFPFALKFDFGKGESYFSKGKAEK